MGEDVTVNRHEQALVLMDKYLISIIQKKKRLKKTRKQHRPKQQQDKVYGENKEI